VLSSEDTASDPPRRPVNLITHDYRNAVDRAAAERTLSADELAKQAALEDQKKHYLGLQRRFVEADQELMLALLNKQACGSVDFLGFCRGFGSQLKGVGAEHAGWQTVGVKLFGLGEVTVSDLRQLFDDFDEDGNGLLTKEEFVKKISLWRSAGGPGKAIQAKICGRIGRRAEAELLKRSGTELPNDLTNARSEVTRDMVARGRLAARLPEESREYHEKHLQMQVEPEREKETKRDGGEGEERDSPREWEKGRKEKERGCKKETEREREGVRDRERERVRAREIKKKRERTRKSERGKVRAHARERKKDRGEEGGLTDRKADRQTNQRKKKRKKKARAHIQTNRQTERTDKKRERDGQRARARVCVIESEKEKEKEKKTE